AGKHRVRKGRLLPFLQVGDDLALEEAAYLLTQLFVGGGEEGGPHRIHRIGIVVVSQGIGHRGSSSSSSRRASAHEATSRPCSWHMATAFATSSPLLLAILPSSR